MPPKTARRGGASTSGAKRGGKASRAASKAAEEPKQVEEASETKLVEEEAEKPVEVVPVLMFEQPEIRVEPQIKVNPQSEPEIEKNEEMEVKDLNQEYEKDERLDLEDNGTEDYEPEEYEQMDYDEKGSEHEEYVMERRVREGEEDNMGEEEVEEEVEEPMEETDGEEDEAEEERRDGEEEEDHQEALNERRKRKEFEVFVGGLDKDATEDDLRKAFGQVGEVTEVRLVTNPQTKKNKGFAFLRFATVEQAKRAVNELKNPVVHGKPCGVSPSQDSDALFLGNICKTWTKEAVKEKLKSFGVENVDDLTLVEDGDNKGMNRGFAFLEFPSRSEAKDAYKRLQRRDVSFGMDRPAKVLFADSFIDPGDEIMAKVRTVFVDGLHPSWNEDHVRDLLKIYGNIEKIELARNMPTAKRKDFGFVTFDNHDIAVTCAKNINNTDLGDGDKKAKVRARLSRPLQKSRGKRSSRDDILPRRAMGRSIRGPPSRPAPRISSHGRGLRGVGSRELPAPRRPSVVQERRRVLSSPPRPRLVRTPPRSYDRRPLVPAYPKGISSRDYSRREELPPRSRPSADYNPRVVPDRRLSYRDEYSPRMSAYPDISRTAPRSTGNRTFVDDDRSMSRRSYGEDSYAPRFERPSSAYREGRPRDYDSLSGSKRSYSTLDEAIPHYGDVGVRHSRARLDYEVGASQYGDTYGDRHGRGSVGYTSSRSLPSSHDSHGLYSSRQGSYGSGDAGGVYSSSSYPSDYMPRRPDASSRSYSYSNRGVGSSSYMGSGSSGSYY